MSRVDVDAFIRAHREEWYRLDHLARKRVLRGHEAEELVRLYQQAATHLSVVRSSAPDPSLISELSMRVGRARGKIASSSGFSWGTILRFLVISLPAALYRSRWWALGVTAAFLAIAVISGWWVAGSEEAQAAFGTERDIAEYVDESFAAYYSDSPAPSFAAQVWTNNAWIAAQSVAFGITGIWPVFVVFSNAVNVGVAGGIMVDHGAADVFFGMILPHGLLELMAVFVATGAGLQLFWAWVAPGHRLRSRAVAEEGRSLFTIAIGLVGVLGVSGLIEGFVTPSSLPVAIKITIGALALAAYWAYVIILGRRAVRDGETGDMTQHETGAKMLVSG